MGVRAAYIIDGVVGSTSLQESPADYRGRVMRLSTLFVAFVAALSLSTAAFANGHHGHHGHHGGYVHHGHHAGGYGMPGYGYGNPGVRTGFYPNPYGYMTPYQALYMQQLMMQRAMFNNGRINAGPGVWRP